MKPPITKGKSHGVVQPTYGCSGKRNGQVGCRKSIKNPLGSLFKVFRQHYCMEATSESLPADKQ